MDDAVARVDVDVRHDQTDRRKLAWVVHGLTTDTPVEEVALRAAAHLAVIETALEEIS